MKGKLIKLNVGVGYRLNDEHGDLFASTLQSSKTKLSIQNCDEIFGIVDVEKLAEEELLKAEKHHKLLSPITYKDGIKKGINKAMELNKDKVFTLGQLKTAMDMARVMTDGKYVHSGEEIFQFLQQPTEIEVEVVMDKIPADLAPGGWDEFPKLDSQGCLILKRVI
jgi:hypothetical protein